MTDGAGIAMEAVLPSRCNADAFAAWAAVYDHQHNPLITLEERYLPLMLEEVRRADIVDVGCGTGRWLSHLALRAPRSLHGIDASPEMLNEALKKNIPGVQLSLAACTALPLDDESADLVLCSFVASYVEDLTGFAKELYRVTRRGGSVFVTDMHPETASRLGWKRGFHGCGGSLHAHSWQTTVLETLRAFREAGFSIRAFIEAAFGEPERHIFAAQSKLEQFDEAGIYPAIYILHLKKDLKPEAAPGNEDRPLILEGARFALGPGAAALGSILVEDGQIVSLGSQVVDGLNADRLARVDLRGFLILPGLVNAHDHLEFALFPRLGQGPYSNATQWAHDIQSNEAATIALHKVVPMPTRLWWGGIRNLLCGVTTVCHHNPTNPVFENEDFPVRVLAHFGWEHSLAFAHDIPSALQQTPHNAPFILHACEGVDTQAESELRELDRLGALEQRTVLVHALALGQMGVDLIAERGAAVILCPSSNDFLFGKVPDEQLAKRLPRLALGSDSPLTAAGDLLDEIRFASKACGIDPQRLYESVTTEASSILRLKDGEGALRIAGHADLIAVRDRDGSSAEILGTLTWRDIELVLLGGRVRLASEEVFQRLSDADREGLQPLKVAGVLRWLRAPVVEILREAESVLGEDSLHLGVLPISGVGENFSSHRDGSGETQVRSGRSPSAR